MDDTFRVIRQYGGAEVSTAQHGTVLVNGLDYYSFGANPFGANPDQRDLVFHRFDTSMQITFVDTFGRPGQDDYPFIYRSLDVLNDEFLIGGILEGPIPMAEGVPLKFFLAKYDHDMQMLWYREYGGGHNYRINGLKMLSENRYLVYGYRLEPDDGIRYPYILIVDENGEITSTNEAPKISADFFQVLYAVGSTDLILDIHEPIHELQLMTIDGRIVFTRQDLGTGRHVFDMSDLVPGVYPVVAHSQDGKTQSGKWVKRR